MIYFIHKNDPTTFGISEKKVDGFQHIPLGDMTPKQYLKFEKLYDSLLTTHYTMTQALRLAVKLVSLVESMGIDEINVEDLDVVFLINEPPVFACEAHKRFQITTKEKLKEVIGDTLTQINLGKMKPRLFNMLRTTFWTTVTKDYSNEQATALCLGLFDFLKTNAKDISVPDFDYQFLSTVNQVAQKELARVAESNSVNPEYSNAVLHLCNYITKVLKYL